MEKKRKREKDSVFFLFFFFSFFFVFCSAVRSFPITIFVLTAQKRLHCARHTGDPETLTRFLVFINTVSGCKKKEEQRLLGFESPTKEVKAILFCFFSTTISTSSTSTTSGTTRVLSCLRSKVCLSFLWIHPGNGLENFFRFVVSIALGNSNGNSKVDRLPVFLSIWYQESRVIKAAKILSHVVF